MASSRVGEERHHRPTALHPCGRTRVIDLAADDLDDGDKGEGLAAARARAADQVLTVQNGLEALRLDTVQGGDSLGLEPGAHLLGEVEAADVIFVDGGVAVGGFLSVIVGNLSLWRHICSSESGVRGAGGGAGGGVRVRVRVSVGAVGIGVDRLFFFFFAAATAASSSSFFLDCLEALPALAMALVDSTSCACACRAPACPRAPPPSSILGNLLHLLWRRSLGDASCALFGLSSDFAGLGQPRSVLSDGRKN